MTVQSDLQKTIAYCEATKGTYALMAESTEDQQAKQTFNTMKADMDRHIEFLNNRLEYLTINNPLNQEK
ncbi:MAG: DUF1657 domain-containing protein [Clostridiaceae bacterium]|nr:DUF1657 domain-containing protein [Clostridiaceae bacterium]